MKNILREFKQQSSPTLNTLVSAFARSLTLTQLGGESRKYTIGGEGQKGAIYLVGNGPSALAFGWSNTPDEINTVYYWKDFDFDRSPDYCVDIPEGNVTAMIPAIMRMIKNQTMGQVNL